MTIRYFCTVPYIWAERRRGGNRCLWGRRGGKFFRRRACSIFSLPGLLSTMSTNCCIAVRECCTEFLSRTRSELRRMDRLGALLGVSLCKSVEFFLTSWLGTGTCACCARLGDSAAEDDEDDGANEGVDESLSKYSGVFFLSRGLELITGPSELLEELQRSGMLWICNGRVIITVRPDKWSREESSLMIMVSLNNLWRE